MSRIPPKLCFRLLPVYFLVLSTLRGQDPASIQRISEPAITAADRSHWAFHKPVPQLPHEVGDAAWADNPIDRFILPRLEKAGLGPAPAADRITLLRRITFDLTGLPPTPEEVDSFVHDSRPDAYSRVVDRLLASPHYGERWAQHSLDVVRYPASHGGAVDRSRPHAWHHRAHGVNSSDQLKPSRP